MKKSILLSLLFLSLLAAGQDKLDINSKFSIRGIFGIPRPISSSRFHTTFRGVYEAGLSCNYRITETTYAGLGFNYSNFSVSKQPWAAPVSTTAGALYYKTAMINQGVYLKVGYDQYFSDLGYTSISMNGGYMMVNYTKVNPDTLSNQFTNYANANWPHVPTSFNAPYLQPELSFNFIAERYPDKRARLSFSLLLSYTTLFYHFDARAPRYYHIGDVHEATNKYFISWVNIGVGFHALIGKK